MGVSYQMVEQNTTDLPSNAGATSYQRGYNIAGGMISDVILRVTASVSAGAVAADFSNVISQARLVLNGSTVFQYNSGYSDATNNAPGQFGYFLNSLGRGRSLEVPSDTSKEAYFIFPVGRQASQGISRLETTIGFSALNAALASGEIQWWIRYNTAANQTTTTVSAATSFTHSAAEENVVVRLPAGVPGTLAGVLVQNDSAADQMNGIRLLSQSTYEIQTNFWRALNMDLANGVMFSDAGASTTEQQYAIQCAGTLFIPLFGLTTDSDLVLQVDSTAATTRTYTPVLTAAINGRSEPQGRQTEALPANVAASVISRVED